MTRLDVGLLVTGNDRGEILRDVSVFIEKSRIARIVPRAEAGDGVLSTPARSC